jgi:hypothetical protein
MKKLIAITLLLTTSSTWAAWTLVSSNADTGDTFYVDFATIRKDGNLRKVWELMDMRKPSTTGTKSRRIRTEYDCKEERTRVLSLDAFSENMASGKLLNSFTEVDKWIDIPPGTVVEDLLKAICKK